MKPVQAPLTEFTDERGRLLYNNSLDLSAWRRLYFLENSELALSRGWHGHRTEEKCFIPVIGSFIVHTVCIDEESSELDKVVSFNMDAAAPTALFVPKMHANKITAEGPSARLLVLSSRNLEESLEDIVRYPLGQWARNP